MTLQQIKDALKAGKRVHWISEAYQVIDGGKAGLLIECKLNGHCIGLTWADGVTMNGSEKDFFTWQEVPTI